MFQRSRDETSYKVKMLGKFYACLKNRKTPKTILRMDKHIIIYYTD